ncbi:hypothetical protein [Alloactinosynnema sp. L-07]|uniref:hypothetical protein n=1 Tax=Alloactinosynnema sp. L-07 TaxID=1653480 RepID=UPI0006B40B52|nr:hypothetical protein [Alloactinosynnema sp. L-07]
MGGDIKGETGAMRDFAQLGIPLLKGDLVRAAPGACPSPYGVSIANCPSVIQADLASTERLQRFLTHMTQGLAAYATIALECADIYTAGNDNSTKAIESIRRPRAEGLPDVAPELRPPAPGGK